MSGNTDYRVIPPGSCTWCGHEPHDNACTRSIKTIRADAEPCPCTRRTT